MSTAQDVIDNRQLKLSNRRCSIVSAMFSGNFTGPGRAFKLDALASLFLTEIIDLHCQQSEEASLPTDLGELEKAVVETLPLQVSENPAAAISV